MTQNNYTPHPEHKFTFGLWTVGNRGRDPFGDATRASLSPVKIVKELSRLGAYGVNLHDNDLLPIDAGAAERDRIVRDFTQALDDNGMKVPMATTNLFYDPVFKDGRVHSSDPRVRLYGLAENDAFDGSGAEFRCAHLCFWGGREGAEFDAAKDPREALKWNREL
jgi:xylose isomerase